jgi:hypothetical protein
MFTLPAEELELCKEYHQAVAMLHARSIRTMYSKDRKQKARSECLAHLRASLCPSVAAEGRVAINPEASV